MGMLFGGWAKEDAEEKLWYIEKYGLMAGTLAYDQAQREYQERVKYNQEHPTPVIWSKTEPKVTVGDVICKGIDDKGRCIDEAYVREVTDEGHLIVDYLDGRNVGMLSKWEGDYKKLCTT